MPTPYTPPIDAMMRALDVAGFDGSPGSQMVDRATVQAILDEAGKLASGVLAPLNWSGDQAGATWDANGVKTAPGFREAYQQYCAGGWNAVPFEAEYGGQGLPWGAAFPVQEMWQAANMSFGLCPLLNQGAVDAIAHHGSDAQKQTYLPKLISGGWTGTMNLTEPQAGSDLGALRTRAEKQADGTYKIFGQKIFITYGDHDLTSNIIHLVLARVVGAPDGPKGISLFIVPKFRSDGTRNDVQCVSIEHKLGIHASPTCTMQFGEAGGAWGELVGAENDGLKYMFTMMNNARLSVGLQGVAMAERATQAAWAYAADRVQGHEIIRHADVKRMLMTMSALTFAARALTYQAAVMLDYARGGDARAARRVEFLTPIVKSFGTDIAQTVTYLAVQVHGGMGFIEETGVAQFYRDARILPIYEGTNGIQAMDLVFRKLARDEGAGFAEWLDDVGAAADHPQLKPRLASLKIAVGRARAQAKLGAGPGGALATPLTQMMGVMAGAAVMARVVAQPGHADANIAQFYLDQILPQADAHFAAVMADSAAWVS